VDQEVAKTLGELELKLRELESELTSIGRRDSQAEPAPAPGKLIDEAVESVETESPPLPQPPPAPQPAPQPPPLPQPVTPPGPPPPSVTEEPASLDVAALVGFREKLARTMDELIDEYSELLSVESPPRPRPGA
jgi:hypothetical protein